MYTSRVLEIASTIKIMLLVFLSSLIAFAQPCFATLKEDTFSFLSQGNLGGVSGTLEASHHFYREDDTGNNFFVNQMLEQEKAHHKTSHVMPLSWNLGFSYSLITVPALGIDPQITDNFITAKGGVDWQITPNLGSSFGISVGKIPEENYSQGSFMMHFDYMFPIWTKNSKKKSKERRKNSKNELDDDDEDDDVDPPKYQSDDATEYYRHDREQRLQKLDREYQRALVDMDSEEEISTRRNKKDDHYPNIKIGYNFDFTNHQVGPKTYTRKVELGSLIIGIPLFQYQNGPELSYSPNDRWTLKASANFNSYSFSVDSFLNVLEIGNIVQTIGAVGSANQSLTFPSESYTLTVDWYPNDRNSFTFNFNYITYASVTEGDTLDFNPMFYRELNKTWRLGVGGDIMYNTTPNLPISFYATIQLVYKF